MSNFTSGGVQNHDTKNDCDVNSGFQASRKTDFSVNLLRNGTIVRCLWENKKTLERSVFREAWSPELTSQSFPVPWFWSHGFVPHRKWNLMLLVHQNTGKENRYGKTFLLYLSVHWGDLIEQIKKICHIHFKVTDCREKNFSLPFGQTLTMIYMY